MTYESLLYSTYEQEKTTAGSKQAHIPSMTQANDEVGVELRDKDFLRLPGQQTE